MWVVAWCPLWVVAWTWFTVHFCSGPVTCGSVDGGTPAWTASLLHVRVQPRQELPWRREEEAMVAWVVTHHGDQPARRIVSEAKLPHQSH